MVSAGRVVISPSSVVVVVVPVEDDDDDDNDGKRSNLRLFPLWLKLPVQKPV